MAYSFSVSLNTKNKLLLLLLAQVTSAVLEDITDIPLLGGFEIVLLLVILQRAQAHPCYKLTFYTTYRPFLIRILLLYLMIAIALMRVDTPRSLLLIVLMGVIYSDSGQTSEAVQAGHTVARTYSAGQRLNKRKSVSDILNDGGRWMDVLDQGYFLCNRRMELRYVNRRGEEFMKELDFSFAKFIDQLVETQESGCTLREVMEEMLGGGKERVKAELSSYEKKGVDSPSCSGSFLCNYKARLWKLNSNFILAILNRKDRFSTMGLNKNIRNATVSTLSHELKTVLNAIIGNLCLLEDSVERANLHLYSLALSSAEILSCKLNDLFDYIQIQENDFKTHPKEFAVHKLVRDISSIGKWFAQQKNLDLSTTVEPEVPLRIIGDELRIKQIMLGILMKAMEYTDFGKVNLRVKMTRRKDVEFQINVMGTGMHYAVLVGMTRFSSKSRKQQYLEVSSQQATKNMGDMDLVIAKLISEAIGAKLKFTIKERGYTRLALCVGNEFPENIKLETPLTVRATRRASAGRRIEPFHEKADAAGESLAPIVEELGKRAKTEGEFEFSETEIPSECSVPEGMARGKYSFSANLMPSAIRASSSPSVVAPLVAVCGRRQSGFLINCKDEAAKFQGPSQPFRNRSENKRHVRMHEDIQVPSLLKLVTKSKCAEDLDSSHILIADDNMSNRFILKALLKKFGYDSVEAQDGSDAVNIVHGYVTSGSIKRLLLIYMDLQMPIMNGIEATKAIIEMCGNAGVNSPPIVGVTANSLEEDRYKFEQSGISEFINKPVDKRKIGETIDRFIKRNLL